MSISWSFEPRYLCMALTNFYDFKGLFEIINLSYSSTWNVKLINFIPSFCIYAYMFLIKRAHKVIYILLSLKLILSMLTIFQIKGYSRKCHSYGWRRMPKEKGSIHVVSLIWRISSCYWLCLISERCYIYFSKDLLFLLLNVNIASLIGLSMRLV